MKIVQFVEAFGGGVYTYVKDLCNFLIKNDLYNQNEIYLIYSSNRVEFNKQLFLSEINPKIHLIELEMYREINISKDYNAIKKTRRILENIKPDILHIHSSKATVIARIAAYNIVNKNKIFYSPHGYAFVQKNISIIKKNIYKTIEFITPKLFGGITIASGDTEYLISKHYGKSILIKNGIDLNLANKIEHVATSKKLTIGTVGRLTPQKNPSFFNLIAKNLPQYNFVWIGDGELIDEITEHNIEVTGWIKTRKDLLEKINNLDIYIQVSLWEGLPISILEAMALKKPLVVSNVVGNRDTVIQNYNGFVYNDINEVINNINSLQNKTLRDEMGVNSYNFCNSDFNINKNFKKLYEVYIS